MHSDNFTALRRCFLLSTPTVLKPVFILHFGYKVVKIVGKKTKMTSVFDFQDKNLTYLIRTNFAHFRAKPRYAQNCAKISTKILKAL